MQDKKTLDLTFDIEFGQFEIMLEAGKYDTDQLLDIFFNHADTWIDEDETGVYVYNDTLAPSRQVGFIQTNYDDNGKIVSYWINREYI